MNGGASRIVKTSNNQADYGADITPDDNIEFDPSIGFRVGTGGDVRFVTARGSEHTWTLTDGEILPVSVKKIFATNTTASGITVLY